MPFQRTSVLRLRRENKVKPDNEGNSLNSFLDPLVTAAELQEHFQVCARTIARWCAD